MSSHILQQTLDGSHTIYIPEMDEHYHSTNGAIQEARHVYISKAYHHSFASIPTVFEVGFGTGLNALLTAMEANRLRRRTNFVTIEKYPLSREEWALLNYPKLVNSSPGLFEALHDAAWGTEVEISPFFYFKKICADMLDFPVIPLADVIYFDAFAPNKQSSLWSRDVFMFMYEHTRPNGILTTYCAKGEVRRTMQAVGYKVERIDGPPGKREMLRATK